MTEEKKVRRSYKLCPCNVMDVEGIQTWLEDMAAQGLLLEKDSIFCGFWSFLKTTPQKVLYRLEVAQRSSIFSDQSGIPPEGMLETAEAMGWKYVTKYKFFYIFCAHDLQAVPLNTDPEIQALTIKRLKKEQRSQLIWEIIHIALLISLGSTSYRYFMLSAVTISLLFSLSIWGFFLFFAISSLFHIIYLQHYEKRLKNGDSLDRRKNWQQRAWLFRSVKVLPVALGIVLLGCLGWSFIQASNNTPLTELKDTLPFATAQDIFPEGEVSGSLDLWDYGSFTNWDTMLSNNVEWREACDITSNGEKYHATMHISSHTTASGWIARWLFADYYRYDSQRYHGKRFEDWDAPEAAVDSLRVYSSYGTRYVLILQDNVVIHASISLRNSASEDAWKLWLDATLDKLLASVS